MKNSSESTQKISALIAMAWLIVLAAVMVFGFIVLSKVSNAQYRAQQAYLLATAVDNAGLDARTAIASLHVNMMGQLLGSGQIPFKSQNSSLNTEMQSMDMRLRKAIAVLKSASNEAHKNFDDMEALLDEWQSLRGQLQMLLQKRDRPAAMQLVRQSAAPLYARLESRVSDLILFSRQCISIQISEANGSYASVSRFVWLSMSILALFGVVAGSLLVKNIVAIVEKHRQTERKLQESEERMKLALSGAEEGTWDLDIVTGRLNFDAQWGELLDYKSADERPHTIQEWSALIHADDRARVLKAMQDHVEGWTAEYKAEYRLRSHSGALRWVAGLGKAVKRDKTGKALRIVGVTRDITLRKMAEEKMWQLAHSDFLTGIPNRALFIELLQKNLSHARRHGNQLAVLFMDLDDFKLVNDQFGHDVGDILLQDVASRLQKCIRSDDTVARTGGDEFLFAMIDIHGRQDVEALAKKIIDTLKEPFMIKGKVCSIGSSVGIALYPSDSTEMEKLITQADEAMYRSKQQGKNRYYFYADIQA